MSDRLYASIPLPQGTRANPMTIAQAVGEALAALEEKVVDRGLRPVWDTVLISTESEVIDNRAIGGAVDFHNITTGEASVLAIDPKEVTE